MAGFALVFDQQGTPQKSDFMGFAQQVESFKGLPEPNPVVPGSHCYASKFDVQSSQYHHISTDEASGSWLFSVGTLLYSSDGETNRTPEDLLSDYLQEGPRVFTRLDGHFAVVIYDRRAEQVVIIADPLGIISIFYGQLGSRVYVATSSLAVCQAVGSAPSDLAMRYFLLHGTVLGEMTLWRSVKRMLPAEYITLTTDGIQSKHYWSFSPDESIVKLSEEESIEYMIEVFRRSLRRSIERECKVWLSLTGGFDSRTLAALAASSGIQFQAYCHGQQDSKDVRIANMLARKMGWEYEYFPLPVDWGAERPSWFSQTIGQSDAHLDVVKTSRIIEEQHRKAKQLDLSLWGFGGEIYRGYQWKQELVNLGSGNHVDYERYLRYRFIPAINPAILDQSEHWKKETHDYLLERINEVGEQDPSWLKYTKLDLIGIFLEHCWGGAHISAVSGKQRVISPFDFKEPAAAAISTSYKWRNHSRLSRSIIEHISPILAEAETTDGGPAMPMRILNFYKFLPYWIAQGQKLAWRLENKALKNHSRRKSDPGKDGTAWPVDQWRRETLGGMPNSVLKYDEMHSAYLYDRGTFKSILTQAQDDNFRYEELLSRIITLELAMRTVNSEA